MPIEEDKTVVEGGKQEAAAGAEAPKKKGGGVLMFAGIGLGAVIVGVGVQVNGRHAELILGEAGAVAEFWARLARSSGSSDSGRMNKTPIRLTNESAAAIKAGRA